MLFLFVSMIHLIFV